MARQDGMDLLWNVDRPNYQITVRIRTGTAIQMVRLRFSNGPETAPAGVWMMVRLWILKIYCDFCIG